MREKLTVLIPCKNEEKNIRPCVESVKDIADEILVADSGSQDRTMQIARELGCRIIEREYVNSADFKNWALPQTSHSWVLVLDADERVTPELAAEVKRLLADTPPCSGYRILRKNHFFGHPIKHCGWDTDDVLRLFNRDNGEYARRRVHADVVIRSGEVGRLTGKLLHYTYWTFAQYFEKFGRYTTWAAQDMYEAGITVGLPKLMFLPSFRFFRAYVLRLGFLDGIPGLLISGLGAFSVFTKYAKLWAMRHGVSQPDPEAERKAE